MVLYKLLAVDENFLCQQTKFSFHSTKCLHLGGGDIQWRCVHFCPFVACFVLCLLLTFFLHCGDSFQLKMRKCFKLWITKRSILVEKFQHYQQIYHAEKFECSCFEFLFIIIIIIVWLLLTFPNLFFDSLQWTLLLCNSTLFTFYRTCIKFTLTNEFFRWNP